MEANACHFFRWLSMHFFSANWETTSRKEGKKRPNQIHKTNMFRHDDDDDAVEVQCLMASVYVFFVS